MLTNTPPRVIRDMIEIEFLEGDGDELTVEAQIWYFDVCLGHVALTENYRPFFEYMRERMGAGTFFENTYAAFLLLFPRVSSLFSQMMSEAGE